MEIKKNGKLKKNSFRKKTQQNYHDLWVPNLIKTFLIQKEKKNTKLAWPMSAKSAGFIYKEIRIFWIASKNFPPWDNGIYRETGEDQEKYKNMGLWNLMFLSYGTLKRGHTFLFSRGQIFCQKTFIPYCSHDCAKTFPRSYALLGCLVLYKNAFLHLF